MSIEGKDMTDVNDPEVWKYWVELAKSDPGRFNHERKEFARVEMAKGTPRQQEICQQQQAYLDSFCGTEDAEANIIRLCRMFGERQDAQVTSFYDLKIAADSLVEVQRGILSWEDRIKGRL